MPWKIFQVDPATATALQKDEIVNRMSLTIKEGSAFGLSGRVVLVEGNEEGLARAEEVVRAGKGGPCEKAEEIHKAIKDEESAAEGGVGFIFGE